MQEHSLSIHVPAHQDRESGYSVQNQAPSTELPGYCAWSTMASIFVWYCRQHTHDIRRCRDNVGLPCKHAQYLIIDSISRNSTPGNEIRTIWLPMTVQHELQGQIWGIALVVLKHRSSPQCKALVTQSQVMPIQDDHKQNAVACSGILALMLAVASLLRQGYTWKACHLTTRSRLQP